MSCNNSLNIKEVSDFVPTCLQKYAVRKINDKPLLSTI